MAQLPENDTLYLTNTLPVHGQDLVDLYKKCWSLNNEHAWYGHIPKDDLHFDNITVTKNILNRYFTKHKYQKHPDKISVYDKCEDSDAEFFAKLVWLTHEYFSGNGFSMPVGVHYNPRLKCNVIHPGGSRNQILHLFAKDKVEAMYFNTGGVEPAWLSTMKKVDIEDLILNQEWAAGAVPDHGSLIPHFSKKTHWIPVGIKRFQRRLYDMLYASSQFFQIHCNENLEYLYQWQANSNLHCDVEVVAHETLSEVDQIKISLLALAGANYKDKNYTVTCKNPIN